MITWQLTIDCADPSAMVRFWGPALGYVVQPPPEAKVVKNRLHLDLYPGGRDRSRPIEARRPSVDEAVSRLLEAGASVVRRSTDDFVDTTVGSYFVVMRDPEGNEFCVS